MWKSTSLNGWEYFIVWKDLGSSPMCAIVCYLNYLNYYFYYSNLGNFTLNFIFAKISFGMNMKSQKP